MHFEMRDFVFVDLLSFGQMLTITVLGLVLTILLPLLLLLLLLLVLAITVCQDGDAVEAEAKLLLPLLPAPGPEFSSERHDVRAQGLSPLCCGFLSCGFRDAAGRTSLEANKIYPSIHPSTSPSLESIQGNSSRESIQGIGTISPSLHGTRLRQKYD